MNPWPAHYECTGTKSCIHVGGFLTLTHVEARQIEVAQPIAVLFDIDETLIHTGGAGARSWKAAFEQLYGVSADIGKHTSAGETDPQVAAETFRAVLGREPVGDELDPLYARYLLYLAEDIWSSKQYEVLPGAEGP